METKVVLAFLSVTLWLPHPSAGELVQSAIAPDQSKPPLSTDLKWLPKKCAKLVKLQLLELGSKSLDEPADLLIRHDPLVDQSRRRSELIESIRQLDTDVANAQKEAQQLLLNEAEQIKKAKALNEQMRALWKRQPRDGNSETRCAIDRYDSVQDAIQQADKMSSVFGKDEILAEKIRIARLDLVAQRAVVLRDNDPDLKLWVQLEADLGALKKASAYEDAIERETSAQYRRKRSQEELEGIDREYATGQVSTDEYTIIPKQSAAIEDELVTNRREEHAFEQEREAFETRYLPWTHALEQSYTDKELLKIRSLAEERLKSQRAALSEKNYGAWRARELRWKTLSKSRRSIEIFNFGREVQTIATQKDGMITQFDVDTKCSVTSIRVRPFDEQFRESRYTADTCKKTKNKACAPYLPYFEK